MGHWFARLISGTLTGLLLLPASSVVAARAAENTAATLPVTVTEVRDGDTLTVRLADGRVETLRLLGVDTPEGNPPGHAAGCFAAESAARTRELALGRNGTVELDVYERDPAGRLLGYLTLEGQQTDLSRQLVTEGFALPLSVGSNTAYSDELRAASRAAQLSGRGIWSACDIGDRPTVATGYPLDETPELWASEPAIRMLLGTERDDAGTVLSITVEARGAGGLGEIVVAGDRPDDPEVSAARSISCGGLAACSDFWSGRPRGLGAYQMTARVAALDGQTAEAHAGLRVVGRWQTIAARAVQVRERATEVRLPTAPPSSSTDAPTACPASAPVKALAPDASGVRRYLAPTDDGYAEAAPQGCFQTEEDARAAGWTR
jgi:endonuclease YncB( thermonuclease family)